MIYWSGGMISNIGTWLQNVTASVVVLSLTHSPFLVGVLNLATFAPIFLLSVLGGMLSDRFDRRLVVVVTQTCSLATATGITVLSALGKLTAATLIALAFVLGAAYALAKPALSALLPATVSRKQLAAATAVNTLQFNIGQLGGSALSAALLALTSATTAFALNAASFLGPIMAMVWLRNQDIGGSRRFDLASDEVIGIRRGRHNPDKKVPVRRSGPQIDNGPGGAAGCERRPLPRTTTLAALLVAVALSNASVEALRTLAPEFIHSSLHLSTSRTGVLISTYSLGATAGLVAFRAISRRLSSAQMLTAAFALQAVGLLGLAISSIFPSALTAAVPVGIGFALNIPALSAGLQLLSPDHVLGRVMSLFSMVHLGLRPLFSLLAGGLATVIDVRLVLALFALFPLVALRLVGAAARALRTAHEATAQVAQP